MSWLIAKVFGLKLPAWVWEVLAGIAVVVAIYFAGVQHEKKVVEIRTVKQEVQVEKQVIVTDHSHDDELTSLRKYHDDHPLGSFRVCSPVRVPEGPSGGQPSATAGNVQPLHDGNSDVRESAGPDVSGLLDLFAHRADEVSANLRRRQVLEP